MSEFAQPEQDALEIRQLFDQLVSPSSIAAEEKAAAEVQVQFSPRAVSQRETELMAAYQDAVRNRPEDIASQQTIQDEMHYLDYMGSKYFYRAGMREYEMQQHPEQLWLDMADTAKTAAIQSAIDNSARLQKQRLISEVPDIAGWPSVIVDGDRSRTMQIPCANLVYAEGFISWEEGRGGEKMPDRGANKSSRAVIDDYASRETELPAIDAVGYIQPNGAIVYGVSDGTHRAAAALQRGNEYIAVQHLRLVSLDYNLVETEDSLG